MSIDGLVRNQPLFSLLLPALRLMPGTGGQGPNRKTDSLYIKLTSKKGEYLDLNGTFFNHERQKELTGKCMKYFHRQMSGLTLHIHPLPSSPMLFFSDIPWSTMRSLHFHLKCTCSNLRQDQIVEETFIQGERVDPNRLTWPRPQEGTM